MHGEPVSGILLNASDPSRQHGKGYGERPRKHPVSMALVSGKLPPLVDTRLVPYQSFRGTHPSQQRPRSRAWYKSLEGSYPSEGSGERAT
jgi:hypothetical protein